jgi:hypothetical protein
MDAFGPLMSHTLQDTLLLLIASLLCSQWGSVSVHISSLSSLCYHLLRTVTTSTRVYCFTDLLRSAEPTTVLV